MEVGQQRGLVLAAITAVISGVAVYVNGLGVRAWSEVTDPSSYTTIKNAVAALTLVSLAAMLSLGRSRHRPRLPSTLGQSAGLLIVATIGGSVPFILFFEGLARTDSTQAAFIHKTLVVWVAALAVVTLRERLGRTHLIAIALLVAGEAALVGGVGGLRAGTGEALILAATLLWSVEVVVAKRLLRDLPPATMSLARMGGGAVVLGVLFAIRGAPIDTAALQWSHVGWILLTGAILAAYVATWHRALALAPAVDVTAVLVGGALITALLRTGLAGAPLTSPVGVALLAAGIAVVVGARRSVPT